MLSQEETVVLQAEVLALQAVMIAVFRRLASDRPDLSELFAQAFDDAETILGGVAEKMGLDAPIGPTVGALEVIDEIREAVIRSPRAGADGSGRMVETPVKG